MATPFWTRRLKTAFALILVIGAIAVCAPWLEQWRPPSPDKYLSRRFRVTSSADAGPETLREAIFAADHASGASWIDVNVGRVELETPLPPLLNPDGIVIDGTRWHTKITARQSGQDALIDVASPDSALLGLTITGAAGAAVLVRSERVRLRNVSIEDSAIGLFLADGAHTLSVDDSSFQRNVTGIQLPGDITGITLQNNQFKGHRRAAIWAVARTPLPAGRPGQLAVIRNVSSGDSQPIVLVNVSGRIEDNVFEDATSPAVFVSGSSALIRRNRIRTGRSFGIELTNVVSGLIAHNEIDHNCWGGIMVRASGNTQLLSNRIYSNGSGIVVLSGETTGMNRVTDNLVTSHEVDGIQVIGASPLIEKNQLLQNRKAGLRLSTMTTLGQRRVVSKPTLLNNRIAGNGVDEQADIYETDPGAVPAPRSNDCAWRLGQPQLVAAAGLMP